MNKTNKEKNTEHDKKELLRVRPTNQRYDFTALEAAIRSWLSFSLRKIPCSLPPTPHLNALTA